ncbi:DNA replication and repair protein RecO [Pilibacter termitis]|uniref:DNA repair protein RecO n=1 Tax=Pilibacter termitis TaxID=263852 RepID=A0A1T4N082_9ENTE|nr:DNA repair protein RecO [Pilibacter termitis]SJZ72709.1 DNA replication and repair protein RecO [Pilibacter termitis]
MQSEKEGIILWTKNHKEQDKMVKLFTKENGKIMCYARGVHKTNHPLKAAIQPFTKAIFLGNFKSDGLSFLNAAKEIHAFQTVQQDIFISAYATYILNLVDAAIEDRIADESLFQLCMEALTMLDNGNDEEIITNIFEVQVLQWFGVKVNFHSCVFCGETNGKFDISTVNHGILCEKHFAKDPRRLHASPKATHLIRMFSAISYPRIRNITVKPETKAELRKVIDELYQEYVGLNLKSKKFLDEMVKWRF